MNWKLEKRKLTDLKPFEKNPRILTKKGISDLKKSIEKFGLAEPIIIQPDGTVIGGHARLEVLKGNGTTRVDVYVPERALNEQEYKELNIRLNKNIAGEFDFDILAKEFGIRNLINYGFDEKDFEIEDIVDLSEFDKGADAYLNSSIRQIVLYYETEIHKKVLEKLKIIGKENDIDDDNSETILKLIEFYESN